MIDLRDIRDDIEAMSAAQELKQALAENAYPAADGTADIDNDAIPLIAITLRSFANAALLRASPPQARNPPMTKPKDVSPRAVVHCWECGPETEDGCSTTCMLSNKHDGPHEWTRDDQIGIAFAPVPPPAE